MAVRPAKLTTKHGYCFWCSKLSDDLTEDHVPPKLLFPKRAHAWLAVVPSCRPCNKAWEKDAEYFRDFLLNGALAGCTHPDLAPIREKSKRAQANREKHGKGRSVFSAAPFTLTTQGIGTGGGLPKRYRPSEIDMHRIGGVIVRSVAAIHGRIMARKVSAAELSTIPALMPEGYSISVTDITSQFYDQATTIGRLRAAFS